MRGRPIKKHFYQKKLFLRWAAHNRRLFSHPPYLLRQEKGSFVIGFRGVSKHITCHFSRSGAIEIRIYYREKIFFDIVTEFDLYEEKTPSGRWVCGLCRDHPHPDKIEPFIEYEDRKKLWIEHSFAPLAAWTQESFTRNARLCLHRSRGTTWAVISQGQNPKETVKSRDFFKKLPVLTARKGKRG